MKDFGVSASKSLPPSGDSDKFGTQAVLRDQGGTEQGAQKMRYWLDTEFIEEPGRIELISLGIVAEDGRELYRQTLLGQRIAAVTWEAPEWHRKHVVPYLDWSGATDEQIRADVLAFCDPEKYGEPEFWGYYADYDWVVFCWLFGKMIDLPKGFPMFCRDIKQWACHLGNPDLPKQEGAEHHALADARWNRQAWEFLRDYAKSGASSVSIDEQVPNVEGNGGR